jgi:sulfur transfer protein SufE
MESIFQRYRQQLDYDRTTIIDLFATHKGWESKYRQIMLLGKQLPPLTEEYKQDEYLVKGCESKVWLHYGIDSHNQQLAFAADSDARIVKGLVVIVLAAFNGLTVQQVTDFDIDDYFARLDLLKHLSPSRSNGIYAIVTTIQAACRSCSTS